MERYNEYKDSGVQWLGEIPSHWDMQRWRFLLTENKVKNTDCKVKVQLQFKYGDIVRKANQDEDAGVLETISKYTVVAPDDIMINGLNLNYDFISQRVKTLHCILYRTFVLIVLIIHIIYRFTTYKGELI